MNRKDEEKLPHISKIAVIEALAELARSLRDSSWRTPSPYATRFRPHR